MEINLDSIKVSANPQNSNNYAEDSDANFVNEYEDYYDGQQKNSGLRGFEDRISREISADNKNASDIPEISPEKTEELRLILKLYKMKFKEELKDFNESDLEFKSHAELEQIRRHFDFLLGAMIASNQSVQMFLRVIYLLENASLIFGILNCRGLTQVLSENQAFIKDLERLSLKFLSSWQTRPELSVPLTIINTAVMLDRKNSAEKNNDKTPQQPYVNKDPEKIEDELQELSDEYADL